MSVLIKGMEMPVMELDWTIRHGADGKWYAIDTNAETSDGEWHEIVPVPPHGRLADLDEIENEIAQLSPEGYTTGGIRLILDYAPTIIPASGEGEK